MKLFNSTYEYNKICIHIEYNNENFVPHEMAFFNDEIPQCWDLIMGSKTNLTFIKKKRHDRATISQNILEEELTILSKSSNHALAITSADFISNRPSFSCAEPFCDTFVSHRSAPLSFPSTPSNVWTKSVAAEDKQAGGKQAIVAHGNPVFSGSVAPRIAVVQRALSSRNTTAEETKIIPPPPSHSVASREMLYFLRRPLRFPPFARFSIFRPSPFSARATARSFAFTPSRGRAFPGRGERRILEIEGNKVK